VKDSRVKRRLLDIITSLPNGADPDMQMSAMAH